MSIKKMTYATAATLVMSTAAFANNLPTDFASLDADKNGSVTFAEYQAHSQTLGLSTTQAAQDFTRAAQGDALLTEEELSLALAFEDQPYALQGFTAPVVTSTEPAPLPVAEIVEDTPVTAYEPMVVETPPTEPEPVVIEPVAPDTITMEPEVIETPVIEPESIKPGVIEPEITETPLEDVMGELETYTPETPVEEGMKDVDENAEELEDPS